MRYREVEYQNLLAISLFSCLHYEIVYVIREHELNCLMQSQHSEEINYPIRMIVTDSVAFYTLTEGQEFSNTS